MKPTEQELTNFLRASAEAMVNDAFSFARNKLHREHEQKPHECYGDLCICSEPIRKAKREEKVEECEAVREFKCFGVKGHEGEHHAYGKGWSEPAQPPKPAPGDCRYRDDAISPYTWYGRGRVAEGMPPLDLRYEIYRAKYGWSPDTRKAERRKGGEWVLKVGELVRPTGFGQRSHDSVSSTWAGDRMAWLIRTDVRIEFLEGRFAEIDFQGTRHMIHARNLDLVDRRKATQDRRSKV